MNTVSIVTESSYELYKLIIDIQNILPILSNIYQVYLHLELSILKSSADFYGQSYDVTHSMHGIYVSIQYHYHLYYR